MKVLGSDLNWPPYISLLRLQSTYLYFIRQDIYSGMVSNLKPTYSKLPEFGNLLTMDSPGTWELFNSAELTRQGVLLFKTWQELLPQNCTIQVAMDGLNLILANFDSANLFIE